MSLLSEHDDFADLERLRASHIDVDGEFPEPFVERESPAQCFWLIVGAALACWLVIGLMILGLLR